MKPRVSAFIATSLDGFIARSDGSIDWLTRANAVLRGEEDSGYHEFMATVDAVVMGRNTFEQVMQFNSWPYDKKRVVVLSRQPLHFPESLSSNVLHSSDSPQTLVEHFASANVRHLYVDGGKTIQSFLNAKVVTDLTITLIPVILGQGRALFGPLESDVPLIHTETRTFSFGFVQLRYNITPAQ